MAVKVKILSANKIAIAVIMVGVALRLYGIGSPFADHHAGRQIQTAITAVSLTHNSFNIFDPFLMADWPVMEFPIMGIVTAPLFMLFGVHDFLARLVAVAFSTGSMAMLYQLAKHYFGVKTAIFTLVFFILSPIGIFFGRTFQPESAMIFFSIGMIYYFSIWIENETRKNFILACFFTLITFLSKSPALYMGLPIAYLAWAKYGWKFFFQWKLWLYGLASLLPFLMWLAYSEHINSISSPDVTLRTVWLYGDMNLRLNPAHYILLAKIQVSLVLTPLGYFLFLIGLFLKPNNRQGYVFHFWLLALVIYALILFAGMAHEYYHYPFVPVASVFAGRATALLQKFVASVTNNNNNLLSKVVILILVVFVAGYSILRINEWYGLNHAIKAAASELAQISTKDDLILDSDGGTSLYYADRKGWGYQVRPVNWSTNMVDTYKAKGGKYFITRQINLLEETPDFKQYMLENYHVVDSNDQFIIFDLTTK